MRSQSLFNFFTKVADVRTTRAGVRVHSGYPTPAVKNESARNAGTTTPARHAEEFGFYLRNYGNPEYGGNVRHAYSTYVGDLRDQYARGAIKRNDFYAARDYARAHLAEDQFNRMWEDYHTYTSPGLYGDTAASPSRMNSRMIHNGNQAHYIFTPNASDRGWNPANMTYDEFGKFFTGADGQMMTREDALAKWNQAWQARVDRRSNGTAVGARSTARANNDTSWRAEAGRQQRELHNAYNNRKSNNPATPLNFKGGYAVNFNPNYVQDWTRSSNATGNWVGGTWYTDEQYMAYNDIYRQLVSSMAGSGRMSQTQAKAEASRLARMYMEDRMRSESGHAATNDWMEPQQTTVQQPAPEPAPADQPPPTVEQSSVPTEVPVQAPIPAAPAAAISTEQSGSADGMSTFNSTNDNNTLIVGGGVASPDNALTALRIPNTPGTTYGLYPPGDNELLSLNVGTPFPLTLSPQVTGRNLSDYTTATTNLLNNSNTPPVASSQTDNGTADTPLASITPAYEAGFEHTSADDFTRQFGTNATNAELLKHYGIQTWNNMSNLKDRIIALRREGRGDSDECKRLIAQFRLARNRYTSIVHAREDMSQDELNATYMPKFNWIFNAANDSSDYWKNHHASWGTTGLHGTRDYLNSMPEEFANFNLLW